MSVTYCHSCDNYIDTDFTPLVGNACEDCAPGCEGCGDPLEMAGATLCDYCHQALHFLNSP